MEIFANALSSTGHNLVGMQKGRDTQIHNSECDAHYWTSEEALPNSSFKTRSFFRRVSILFHDMSRTVGASLQ